MDDTLVAEYYNQKTKCWFPTSYPHEWAEIRVSIAKVEGKNLFDGDTYYRYGDSFIARSTYTYDYSWWKGCTLTPPKPKSVLDSEEFRSYVQNWDIDRLKQFIRDNKEKI
jgi:hypothetical protein